MQYIPELAHIVNETVLADSEGHYHVDHEIGNRLRLEPSTPECAKVSLERLFARICARRNLSGDKRESGQPVRVPPTREHIHLIVFGLPRCPGLPTDMAVAQRLPDLGQLLDKPCSVGTRESERPGAALNFRSEGSRCEVLKKLPELSSFAFIGV